MMAGGKLIFQCGCALAIMLSFSGGRFLSLYRDLSSQSIDVRFADKVNNSATVESISHESSDDVAVWTEVLEHGVVARAFNWSQPLPCFQPDELMKGPEGFRQPATSGFLFMKLIKTGGSTATGITMRIAKHTAERDHKNFTICRGRWDHAWGFKMLENRQREMSFTWTLLREPTKRVVSEFFHFEVSRENRSTSDESFEKFLRTDRVNLHRNFYLKILSIVKQDAIFDDEAPSVINAILSDYDFIGITERMDESAVALMMLLDVPIGDILYLDAKGHGGYDDGIYKKTCFYIQPSFVSPKIRQVFESPFWTESMKWDTLLYQAANRSLDLTIDRLGRDRFAENLAKFQHANRITRERCGFPQEIFPCTSTGQKNKNTTCLWSDSGCGYKCLDQVADDLGLS
jgi:Sulfotransferase family